MDGITLVGTTGASLILLAFIMAQYKVWTADYLIYDLVNFLGALLLVFYALLLESFPFFLLNSVWVVVAFRDVVLDLKRNNKKRFCRGFYKKWME
jgi:hypothetical protein